VSSVDNAELQLVSSLPSLPRSTHGTRRTVYSSQPPK